jgi:putative ABC transport system permease protein
MFFTYLRRELRRRMRQAIFIALGLAVGIGLVITVTAASAGVKNAQAGVLHSLYGVGTDITVTQAPKANQFNPGQFGFRGQTGTSRRKAGATTINVDRLRSDAYGPISASYADKIKSLTDVSAVSSGLVLTDTKISGTINPINFNSSSGGQSQGPGGTTGGSPPSFHGGLTPTITYVEGVQLSSSSLGPLSSAKLVDGKGFTSTDTDSDVALITKNYATEQKLNVGSTVTVGGKKLTVIGIVELTSTATSTTEVYIPLEVAQTLSSLKNQVNTVYVAASNNNDIGTLASAIKSDVPGATVTDQDTLASQVTGSLSSASSLINSLGKWLAIAVLLASFLLASLLTMSAVSRRVREFGTLKALGWPSGRVIGQVMGESIVVGVLGGIAGVALGFGGARLVDLFAGNLSATVPSGSNSSSLNGPGPFAGPFGRSAANTASTVAVHLSAAITVGAIVAAVLLAIAGGLIAGGVGGWRAARLRPAAALAKVA